MLNIITANDLKIKGVSIIDKEISDNSEVLITVHGKTKYVVLPIEQYNYLRECELESALIEARKEIKEGKVKKGNIARHIERIARD